MTDPDSDTKSVVTDAVKTEGSDLSGFVLSLHKS